MVPLMLAYLFVAAVAAAPKDEFSRANEQYQDKQYDAAIAGYQSILRQGFESAPLYFNLGNAYFKKGDLGNAILNYLKARRLDPTDEDIRSNLEFARRLTSVQLEGVTLNPVTSLLESITASWRLNSLAWISSLLFILVIAILIARYGFAIVNPLVKPGLIVALILLMASSYLTTFKYRHDYLTRRAVIVAAQSEVRTGPSEQSDLELQGEPGLVVEILGESSGYYNVLFENQRQGWVKKESVAVI
jgi:tetratricopeptide (TPR) repeat protein